MRIHALGTSSKPRYGELVYWIAVASLILGVVALALVAIAPGSDCVIREMLDGASTPYIRYNCIPTIGGVGEVLAHLIYFIFGIAPVSGIILSVYKNYKDKSFIFIIFYLVVFVLSILLIF